jgi:chloramphenicol O-acetyltransferase type A
MPTPLDLARWSRRAAFEYFRGFDKPYFNVCTRVDVTALQPALQQAAAQGVPASTTLACHYLAMALANAHEPFRLRLHDGGVWLHERVHIGTTVLLPDQSFGFAYLDHATDYPTFARAAQPVLQAAREGRLGFEPRNGEQALVHGTTLPWLHFTSFSHARNWGREDAIPKLAFGRIDREGDSPAARRWMPLSVEVHHALMDGLHVGRYVNGFEAAMRDPLPWLLGGPLPTL